jgi:hypothetical protein
MYIPTYLQYTRYVRRAREAGGNSHTQTETEIATQIQTETETKTETETVTDVSLRGKASATNKHTAPHHGPSPAVARLASLPARRAP